MRKDCTDMVYELAKKDPRVVYIGSDLSPGLLAEMKRDFPDRHHMEGVSEAHLVGMAAGMAMDGFIPYAHTIATFVTRRCYEQVAVDLCIHDLPVRLIGNGGGLVYAPLGPTHQSIEDIAIMRALPNMTIVAPADANEMRRFMAATLDWPHPIYIRLGKGDEKVVTGAIAGFEIGKGYTMREATGPNAPVLIVATGVTTAIALQAAEILAGDSIGAHVLHMPTVKPIDEKALLRLARGARLVAAVEEHSRIGGLGSAVLETLSDALDAPPPVLRLGIPDVFAKDYGAQSNLMESFGLTPTAVAASIRGRLGAR